MTARERALWIVATGPLFLAVPALRRRCFSAPMFGDTVHGDPGHEDTGPR